MPEQSLKSKTVKGASWSLVDSISSQGITFLVGLVLARLLSPEEYGLIGIITIFIILDYIKNVNDSGYISQKSYIVNNYQKVYYLTISYHIINI